ncbi:hypothetical protein KFE25_002150 [Diacronema lutheri]|uniref:Tr-type G domain-containing protein n=1 Tax=Diacronema lutheri TaxID=2081491 RepID=A0A8J5XMU6_DIALT|nr:hypothetical protein KFE25_002150 [Diacronema lutheri]
MRGHAFVEFASADVAALAVDDAKSKRWSVRGRELTIEPRGGSFVHVLRRQLLPCGEKVPRVQYAGARAFWTLPSALGGGLVAAPAAEPGASLAKKRTKAALAAESLRFLAFSSTSPGAPAIAAPADAPAGASAGMRASTRGERAPATLSSAPAIFKPSTARALAAAPAVADTPAAAIAKLVPPPPLRPSPPPPVHSPDAIDGGDRDEHGAHARAREVEPPAHPPCEDVRNVCVIAHVDHGKTTLADCLLAAAGQLSAERAGKACALDVGLEAERGITIHASAVSLGFAPSGRRAEPLRLTLVDCPGHAEFSSEVTAALRLCDGALLLVDVSDGLRASAEEMLRQALEQGVPIVLVLNKLDRALPAVWPSDAPATADCALLTLHARMCAVIAHVNDIVRACGGGRARPVSLYDGSVLFGSGYDGWFASLHDVAELYADRAARALLRDAAAAAAERQRRTLKGLPAAVPLADAVADKL